MRLKKMLTAALTALMICTAFAGCNSSPTTSDANSSVNAGGGSSSSSSTQEDSSSSSSESSSESSSAESGGTANPGQFIMGLDDSFPPMGFRDENNELVGFDIDLATEVCKRLDLELVLQPIVWDTKEMELEAGNVDVLWNGLTITDERKEQMLMSRPYLKNNQVICVRADSDIASKADLEGKIIGIQSGSSAEEALAKDEINDKVGQVIASKDNITALLDMKTGGVDAVILDEVVANYYAAQEPESYKVLEDSLAAEEYGIAFKKGNTELHDKVMAAFDEMIADGTAAEISEKWFGKDIIVK